MATNFSLHINEFSQFFFLKYFIYLFISKNKSNQWDRENMDIHNQEQNILFIATFLFNFTLYLNLIKYITYRLNNDQNL